MIRPNPLDLARRQLARDRRATARFEGLFEHKLERMSASPLAYLRGAAPLYYALLADFPSLREGPKGKGWLCGDAHLENFGVYRTRASPRAATEAVVFDINDFDEAFVGPWRYDVLRLVTSLILGGRELGFTGPEGLELASDLLEAYVQALSGKGRAPAAARPVVRLIRKVTARSHRDLLDGRTHVAGRRRRFRLGKRYAKLDRAFAEPSMEAFRRYVKHLETRHPAECFEVLDVAFRIAGTGSLGGLRVAVLTAGTGGKDGAWLFDMKEEGTPAAARVVEAPEQAPDKRVLTALTTCIEHVPRLVGGAKLGKMRLVVRRLAAQDDKLNLTRIEKDDLPDLARQQGALLGRAHRRGASKPPRRTWTLEERGSLIERAILLAGLHEASYLAMCRLRPA